MFDGKTSREIQKKDGVAWPAAELDLDCGLFLF